MRERSIVTLRTISGKLGLTAAAAALVWATGANEAAAIGCEDAADAQFTSCQNEAWADYWLEVAKAQHISSSGQRKAALKAAAEDLEDALSECSEQLEARLDLCSALGENVYDPSVAPNNFDNPVPNPYFPLEPGTTRTYEKLDGSETVVVSVLDETFEILGIECIVVRDIEYEDGEVVEDTRDYFATDDLGNVWYLGEHSLEIEDGIVVGTGGSWIAGEDGAKPGIIMPANPTPGFVYRQEYDASNAEDAGEILSTDEDVTVPFGTFSNCVQTADFTPIEPGNLEHKFYAAGVGLLKEVDVNSGEEVVLVDVVVE